MAIPYKSVTGLRSCLPAMNPPSKASIFSIRSWKKLLHQSFLMRLKSFEFFILSGNEFVEAGEAESEAFRCLAGGQHHVSAQHLGGVGGHVDFLSACPNSGRNSGPLTCFSLAKPAASRLRPILPRFRHEHAGRPDCDRPARPAHAGHQIAAPQLGEQLLQVGQGDALALGNIGQGYGAVLRVQRQIEHGGDGVTAFGGQSHGSTTNH